MTITVRPIRASDEDAFVVLAKRNVDETLQHLSFEEDVVRFYFRYSLNQDSIHIFVTQTSEGILTGFMVANLEPYLFRRGFLTSQEVSYVLPEYRATRSGALLLHNYETWSKARDVDESFVGIANGVEAERKLRYFERKGYERVGYYLRKIKSNEETTSS